MRSKQKTRNMKIQETEGKWITIDEHEGIWLNCEPITSGGYALVSLYDEKEVVGASDTAVVTKVWEESEIL